MLYLDNPLRALGLSGDAPTERIVAAISSASPMLTVFDDGRFLAGTDAIARLGERHARLLARAAWFTGWAQPVRADEPWKRALLAQDRPTAKATVWLLTDGWKRHGLLRFDERPG